MSELLDNRAHRVRTLKNIIKKLHAGSPPESVRVELKQLVKACDATEIAQMETELIAEGMDPKEIMSMCDLHAELISEILVESPPMPNATSDDNDSESLVSLPTLNTPPQKASPVQTSSFGMQNADNTPADLKPGHPVDTFKRENAALADHVAKIRTALTNLAASNRELDDIKANHYQARLLLNELMDIEKHYDRKENLLFSMLERHGITGPSTVMWGKDDQVRALLKTFSENFLPEETPADEWRTFAQTVAASALDSVVDMIFKEEHILLPMSLKALTATEWAEIFEQSPLFGWCLVDPQEGYIPPKPKSPTISDEAARKAESEGIALDIVTGKQNASMASAASTTPGSELIMFPTGQLNLEQLKMIFSTLPVDLTYVDAEDRVRFFSEGPKRVFHRPKAVIGRLVQHCHPPGSVHIVDQILEDFKSGKQSLAEFWINMKGKFIHIRYFALRDENEKYMGTLEITQDLTHERSLEGDRRLLSYD
ncbi:DUF438 domain-containing protein [Poriferisphaera sp. WC338]|uniref:DUF438 domain-containing protein n=1 Tax=Poriferisphaera sp. WC338 TaxID=3425129 RepID=UPI003D815B8A